MLGVIEDEWEQLTSTGPYASQQAISDFMPAAQAAAAAGETGSLGTLTVSGSADNGATTTQSIIFGANSSISTDSSTPSTAVITPYAAGTSPLTVTGAAGPLSFSGDSIVVPVSGGGSYTLTNGAVSVSGGSLTSSDGNTVISPTGNFAVINDNGSYSTVPVNLTTGDNGLTNVLLPGSSTGLVFQTASDGTSAQIGTSTVVYGGTLYSFDSNPGTQVEVFSTPVTVGGVSYNTAWVNSSGQASLGNSAAGAPPSSQPATGSTPFSADNFASLADATPIAQFGGETLGQISGLLQAAGEGTSGGSLLNLIGYQVAQDFVRDNPALGAGFLDNLVSDTNNQIGATLSVAMGLDSVSSSGVVSGDVSAGTLSDLAGALAGNSADSAKLPGDLGVSSASLLNPDGTLNGTAVAAAGGGAYVLSGLGQVGDGDTDFSGVEQPLQFDTNAQIDDGLYEVSIYVGGPSASDISGNLQEITVGLPNPDGPPASVSPQSTVNDYSAQVVYVEQVAYVGGQYQEVNADADNPEYLALAKSFATTAAAEDNILLQDVGGTVTQAAATTEYGLNRNQYYSSFIGDTVQSQTTIATAGTPEAILVAGAIATLAATQISASSYRSATTEPLL